MRTPAISRPARVKEPQELLCCSFCRKSQHEVFKLIAGPDGDFCICDECVTLCADIVHEALIDAAHDMTRGRPD